MATAPSALLIKPQLLEKAHELASELQRRNRRIVFAESCTAGWLPALLSTIPGISESLCGSAVVYREGTKQHWLDISSTDLADPAIGVVSAEVAAAMARHVLNRTSEADLAVSITGHLGPNAPPALDGVVYIGLAERASVGDQDVRTLRYQLAGTTASGESLRWTRQQQAIELVLQMALDALCSSSGNDQR
ncbi:MAG: CinA family protein [Planctomycetaceae bacterium]|nr:CinA family protein [Planctomycetaceae bacterium]